MEIIVVASHERPSIILDHLKDRPHQVSYAPKYPFVGRYIPAPEYRALAIKNHVGPFRCFRAHQDALKKSTHTEILIFEDDAMPARDDWYAVVEKCLPLLKDFDIVSLHGRNIIIDSKFEYEGMTFVIPGPKEAKVKWSLGSLSYLVKKETAVKLSHMQYRGCPMDLLLASNFKFCTLPIADGEFTQQSPFHHERKYNSLVEGAR